jgi:hypothetical protein
MARKPWQTLTDAYRRRLQRAGITPREYRKGASLKAARGHSKTPERPTRALRKPQEYREYIERRTTRIRARNATGFLHSETQTRFPDDPLTQRVYERIMEWFPDDGYYDEQRKKRNVPAYFSSQGLSWDHANSLTVELQLETNYRDDPQMLRSIMRMSRGEFQEWASHMAFWYH